MGEITRAWKSTCFEAWERHVVYGGLLFVEADENNYSCPRCGHES